MIYRLTDFLAFQYYRKSFARFLKSKSVAFNKDFEVGPLGPIKIIQETLLMTPEELDRKKNKNFYLSSRLSTVFKWFKFAEHDGLDLNKINSVLDFGCGSGRLIRHLKAIESWELAGTDISLRAIQWCQNNLSGIIFHMNNFLPPLDFANDEQYDLILAQSVFTHIPIKQQDEWLKN